jgi:hypothetical protein
MAQRLETRISEFFFSFSLYFHYTNIYLQDRLCAMMDTEQTRAALWHRGSKRV